ncbi:uncharacterized protein IWZ02DRAFT_128004 [Phyllosticta citriasiana]|uniref:uncharacterized protein n=1 Tax=Phyllosticta citriasiana TaxID=595635 RepID=UPI0030FDC312
MSLSMSPYSKPLSFLAFFTATFMLFLLCASPASALAVPSAPARAKALAAVSREHTADSTTHSLPIAVPGSKNLPFELPPCEDEAACAEALWRAGGRVNAHAKEEATDDETRHAAAGGGSSSRGRNRNTALTEQLNGRRRPFEAPEWSRIF